ncbi:(2Fe-2S)-binding protein [Emcibacter nanhaiensis]|uniref:(2Fe-2S)-binding protein n=1 Tax=Emcibacter nanhaiensis TaxID=1505037 RepID=A0A501PJ32_9PROT|nr:(2Fe-2S)-binding protein [Emcibacter nanhaiensis]TPD60235.1 (2Fe-2S)-binding protein [Emcibacter nanhaiensis]
MAKRVIKDIDRSREITLTLNGAPVTAYRGETLATVIMLSGDPACRSDRDGQPRAPFCNMGVCYDCLVEIGPVGQARKVRACMTPVREGLEVRTLVKKGDGS